jgi:hypothetical protein
MKPYYRSNLFGTILCVAFMAACCLTSHAQIPLTPDQLPAAPPMRTIPEAERHQLEAEHDSKSRIKKTIELAEGHLAHAETEANEQQFDRSLRELGMYLALIEDSFKFLDKVNKGDHGKSRTLYKHIEIALRAHGSRLTVMRRATPLDYATRMKEVEDFAREGRTDALNAFFGHTVERDGRQNNSEENSDKPADKPPTPERQP